MQPGTSSFPKPLPSAMAPTVSFQVSDALFRLALDALSECGDESAVVSPFSIAMAMAAANLGARGNSSQEITDGIFDGIPKEKVSKLFRELLVFDETKDFIKSTSCFGQLFAEIKKSRRTEQKEFFPLRFPIKVASAVFLDVSLTSVIYLYLLQKTVEVKKTYTKDLVEYLKSDLKSVDFLHDSQSQVAALNEYVEEKTEGKIKDLFNESSIDSSTRIVLVNAVRVTVKFEELFYKERTKPEPFYNEDGTTKEVPMMNDSKKGYFTENDQFVYTQIPCDGIALPKTKSDFCFSLIVPKNGKLADLKHKFKSNGPSISSVIADAPFAQLIRMALPKFKAENSYNLVDTLRKLGISDIFDKARADFSGISDTPLVVDMVAHKAVIELDEKGVEGAAAKTIGGAYTWRVEPPKVEHIRADKPFLYTVTYKDIPVFVGQFY
uniref:SERPIN domain-containing protein n=1 Tax=Steinernema glaseri TaxID=37863 RepID=A0A1I7Y578_9BILA